MSDLDTPSSTGLAPNVAGALAYALGPVTGIAFIVLEKQSRFVRFHAMQSTLVSVVLVMVNVVLSVTKAILSFIPFIGGLFAWGLSMVVGVVTFALWVMLMYMAYQGRQWELPFVGEHARKFSEDSIAIQ